MSKQNSWFEVDKEGLKQLQAGKPKHYLLRELIQNAWDEKVKTVKLDLTFKDNIATITIEDDCKEGFKDLRDSYVLYKETSKRKNPEQRGRFNLGEKQAFSICEQVILTTTKGQVLFNKDGRTMSTKKKKLGTMISVLVKMNRDEFNEMSEFINLYIVPQNIKFYVNGQRHSNSEPFKSFKANLTTEINDNVSMRRTSRITQVNLYENEESYLYEMGIPVTKIDCEWSIDVQQKIPLSVDRETVPQSYLRDVLSEVLNNTFDKIEEENSSQNWIREGMSDERINEDAVKAIIDKRYGKDVCVADPFDTNSIDEAISHGYRVIRGNEMSKEEWNNIKRFNALDSSSKLYGTNFTSAKNIEPNKQQLGVATYAIKIAKRLLNIDIAVTFVNERDMVAAQFGNRELVFNVAKLGRLFFEKAVTAQTTNLILHEIGHYAGNHTESSYHELITKMAGQLVIIALEEPEFFKF